MEQVLNPNIICTKTPLKKSYNKPTLSLIAIHAETRAAQVTQIADAGHKVS